MPQPESRPNRVTQPESDSLAWQLVSQSNLSIWLINPWAAYWATSAHKYYGWQLAENGDTQWDDTRLALCRVCDASSIYFSLQYFRLEQPRSPHKAVHSVPASYVLNKIQHQFFFLLFRSLSLSLFLCRSRIPELTLDFGWLSCWYACPGLLLFLCS